MYRHEIGGRNPLEAAIEIDPWFIAPRVWRTPTIIAEEDDKTIADHKAGLQSLYQSASAFEQAMITWAKAVIDEEPTKQLRQLRVAHKQEPGNRPVRMVLAGRTLALGNVDEAWQLLESLLQSEWCYPPLFALAATCALQRKEIDDFRGALEMALECKPVAPESLALLRLLAVYEGDAEGETRYGQWLERRTMEMLPEIVDVDVSGPAELLAARAENEGRQEIADRLRESAN